MIKLSVVILTLDEEKNIERCILSVKNIADEILVVDSFSTDKTEEICTRHGVHFVKHKFEGYIEQKNWALDQASNDIVLSLDADEALSEKLQQSIADIKNNWLADAYIFNRITSYCGKWIKHGGWYPDRKLRLWNRTKGRWGGTNPHDKVVLLNSSSTRTIKGDIQHYSFDTAFDFFYQSERFSTIAAKALFAEGKRISIPMIILKSYWKFIKDYFFKFGFLDGFEGFIICKVNASATFAKYVKLHYLTKINNSKKVCK